MQKKTNELDIKEVELFIAFNIKMLLDFKFILMGTLKSIKYFVKLRCLIKVVGLWKISIFR